MGGNIMKQNSMKGRETIARCGYETEAHHSQISTDWFTEWYMKAKYTVYNINSVLLCIRGVHGPKFPGPARSHYGPAH